MYLIYTTEEAACERADEEGKAIGYTYWTKGKGTRWLTKPVPTADGKWALDVFEYCLLYTSPSPRDRTRSRMPSSA